MKSSTIASALVFGSVAFATPIATLGTPESARQCVNISQAMDIVSKFHVLLRHDELAATQEAGKAILAENFTEYSDSILSLGDATQLGGAVVTSRESYLDALMRTPPVHKIDDLHIGIVNCSNIIWHWRSNDIGLKLQEVKGFNLMTLNEEMQIQTMQVEFNSIAWAQNLGFNISKPFLPPAMGRPNATSTTMTHKTSTMTMSSSSSSATTSGHHFTTHEPVPLRPSATTTVTTTVTTTITFNSSMPTASSSSSMHSSSSHHANSTMTTTTTTTTTSPASTSTSETIAPTVTASFSV